MHKNVSFSTQMSNNFLGRGTVLSQTPPLVEGETPK